ncbi:MAG: hypothetical protein A2W59_02145 [Candidatus Terrybacteria bacterium RIFCSPHIGHO2_02_41_19]|uniref:Glycosyl transferase family 1 domain-containing protein n=2 Tax=Candidatus Terryibacteriota TaxID=1817920 RepID=A0A1G2PQ39_9BACT|nr:MAG: hypothetical protein A2W59_02145 [Candidatus Terrybacteria bacterium RIFCSPHIGHO2_02_41_19]
MDFYEERKKRVLIFSLAYIPFASGAELAVKEITNRIKDIDFDIITLRFDRKWAKKEKIGNVNIYRIGGGKLFFSFFAFWKARKFHKKNGYDSVWSIMANRAGFAALFFKLWRPKVKYLLTLQEGDTLDYPEKRMGLAKIFIGGLFKKIFTKADYVQAISNYLADWAKNMGAKAPVEVVPNGVSINKYEIRNPKSETNLKSQNSNIKTIITTSRLVRKNGVDTLIKAMAILYVQHRMSNIKLQILGDGQDEKKLKDLAKELNVQNVVRFLGHIEPEYVYKYLAEADIFVRPSRTEGLGSSFLEAMGAGLPIIGAPVGGIPDFLKDGETGLFCKVDDSKDLAEKIKKLIMDETLVKRIAENGRRLVLEKYDWDNVAKQMKEIFKTMGRKLNILICTGIYPPDIGGPAKYAKNLTDEFSRNGNKVKVLAYGMEKKMPIGARHFWYFLRTIFALPKADLIIGLDIFSTGFPAVLAGKIFGKKTILRVGGDFLWETYIESTGHLIKLKDFYEKQPRLSLKFKIIALLQKFALKNTSALAFNTGWQKDFFEKIYKLNPRKNFIIENFYPEKSVVAEKINKVNEFNFLFAGRKIKFKNLKLLEEVFEDLESAGIKARLDIVDGLTQKELQEKIKNSYAAITVSISDFAPNFVVESLSYNKPFILTKDCGLAEKLDGLGVIVDPIDKNSIKKAILLLLDENNYKRYKEKIAEFNFTHSWKEIAQEFLAIYKTR